MPKKSPSPPATAAVSHHKPWLLIIFAALVILVVGFLFGWQWYQGNQVAADKARFAQAERDIDDLSKQIVAVTGQPAKVETDKYCSRPNIKFEEGPLSCDIHWYSYYEVNDAVQATAIYKQAREIFSKKWPDAKFESLSNESSEMFRELDASDTSSAGDFLRIVGRTKLSNDMTCDEWNGFYIGSKPPFTDIYQSPGSKYVLAIEFSCGDKAQIEHFPMKS